MTKPKKMTAEGADLLKAVQQMKANKRGREYSPEQLLAIAARQSLDMTQTEFALLLDVSVDAIQDWEQGRRTPRGAARTLLRVAQKHPSILRRLNHVS
jgi:putative transcriptional regulator